MASKKQKQIKRTPLRSLVLAGAATLAATIGGYFLSQSHQTSEKPENNKPVRELAQPKVKRPQLTFDVLPTIPGVKRVLSTYGDSPEVVYILLNHQNNIAPEGEQESRSSMPDAESISYWLHDKYGVHSLLMEPIDENEIKNYRRGKRVYATSNSKSNSAKIENDSVSRLLNSRKWDLYPGTKTDLEDKIKMIHAPLMQVHADFLRELNEKESRFTNSLANGNVKREDLQDSYVRDIGALRLAKQSEVDRILTPTVLHNLHTLIHPLRDTNVISQARRCREKGETPLIVIYGGEHCEGLTQGLKRNGVGYAALVPEGYPDSGRFSDSPEYTRKNYDIPKVNFTFEDR